MGIFDNFGDVQSAGSTFPYIIPGQYLLRVDRLTVGKSERNKGEFFAAEFTILESDNDERPPGMQVSWAVFPNASVMAPRNIKSLMKAVLNEVDDRKIDGQVMTLATEGEGLALAGTVVKATAHEITTTKGEPFTKINWEAHVA